MIATNIEQSRHLLELGLDQSTADCNWNTTFGDWSLCIGKNKLPHAVPAWSLSALLEVIPSYIKSHHLKIEKTTITDMWYIDYQYFTDSEPRKDLLTAAYEMVCWLLEQGLIKKGGQDANQH